MLQTLEHFMSNINPRTFIKQHIKEFDSKAQCKNAWYYACRSVVLRRLGYSNYQEYLKSDLWFRIRAKCLLRNPYCVLCGKLADTVHHYSYEKPELTGKSLSNLHSICNKCHKLVELRPNGSKRMYKQCKTVFRHLKRKRCTHCEKGHQFRLSVNQLSCPRCGKLSVLVQK